MKVTINIDGKHDSIEVKDKILSVLPDAKYMIFDAGEPLDEPTHFQNIKAMGLEEMASFFCKHGICNMCVYDVPGSTSCHVCKCEDGVQQWLKSKAGGSQKLSQLTAKENS